MEYALGLMNDFNTLFQADSSQFSLLKPHVEALIRNLALNFIKPDYVRRQSLNIDPEKVDEYVHLDRLYMGVSATESLSEIQDDGDKASQTLVVKTSIRNFYVEAILQIQKTFVFHENDHY